MNHPFKLEYAGSTPAGPTKRNHMNQLQQDIITKFLLDNPEYCKVKWNDQSLYADVFFADNPTEPFSEVEFIPNSPTRRLLESLTTSLQEAACKNDANLHLVE